MGIAAHYSVSSTPVPKNLPPLLRARAVALSGKSVGVNIRRKRSSYKLNGEQEKAERKLREGKRLGGSDS